MLHALIMAGGGGTRFWPRSRVRHPKQFLSLAGGPTLLQQAFARLEGQAAPEQTWVITGEAYCDLVHEQLPEVPAAQVVGEPCGRDTAACIALGAALMARRAPDAIMVVAPADHVIEPQREFQRTLQVAVRQAEENPTALITIGVTPTFPATGYGYIHRGPELAVRQGIAVYRVQDFKEKPPFEVAERYVASGEYFWNSGIFVWKVGTILAEMAKNQPAIHDAARRIAAAWDTPERRDVFRREFEPLPRISIDHAVMEHSRATLVVQAPYHWDDVGSWLAVERMHPQDADGNTVLATHCGIQTRDCIIVGDAGQLITTLGVSHLLIIQDGDAILVADKKEEGTVKHLVELLKHKGLERYL